ncbi:hypothetical protein PHLGIDRAFT_166809 [Phlebiopsis gigantea 11061_1 CR5-6]|uniref:Uncharacterized protein n=1 Tax=Phlebiopsis gigantea (strain 11061_1 CR5-6) TaxID=745531 RepID=A0A0C3RV88_PHLG1|nr:hypothetical protein PHLGIDRAFT_166809 [Phlebiopsis gigantea 11061_1 CR5-6]
MTPHKCMLEQAVRVRHVAHRICQIRLLPLVTNPSPRSQAGAPRRRARHIFKPRLRFFPNFGNNLLILHSSHPTPHDPLRTQSSLMNNPADATPNHVTFTSPVPTKDLPSEQSPASEIPITIERSPIYELAIEEGMEPAVPGCPSMIALYDEQHRDDDVADADEESACAISDEILIELGWESRGNPSACKPTAVKTIKTSTSRPK